MSSNVRGTVKIEVERPKAVVKIHPPDEFETLANGDVTPSTITLISTVENFDFPTYVWSRFDGSSWIILGNKTPTLSVGFNKNAESWTERTFRVQVQGHTKNSTSNPSLNKIEGQTDWNLAIVQRKPYVEVGENYIPMGFWDDSITYTKSAMGVPFVKVASTTELTYSVFSLRVSYDRGSNPLSNPSTWKLVDSQKFVFMEQAYIERLQAKIVTADKINALDLNFDNATGKNVNLTGHIDATSGTFSGALEGVTGTFKRLEAIDSGGDVRASINFSAEQQLLTFSGDMQHQGSIGSRELRFLASAVWNRGTLGYRQLTTIEVKGTNAIVYPNGLHKGGIGFSLKTKQTTAGALYEIPLFSPIDGLEGMPINLVIISANIERKYILDGIVGAEVRVVNANDNVRQLLHVSGRSQAIDGGAVMSLINIGGQRKSPQQGSGIAGGDWLVTSIYDNNW